MYLFSIRVHLCFVCRNRLSVKKGAGAAKAGRKSSKKEKDPNKPKRPPSAFFVFMYVFYEYSDAYILICIMYVCMYLYIP